MSQSQHLVGGELNAALTREVVRIHAENLGRGPKKSFTFYTGNIVVTVMDCPRCVARRHVTVRLVGSAPPAPERQPEL